MLRRQLLPSSNTVKTHTRQRRGVSGRRICDTSPAEEDADRFHTATTTTTTTTRTTTRTTTTTTTATCCRSATHFAMVREEHQELLSLRTSTLQCKRLTVSNGHHGCTCTMRLTHSHITKYDQPTTQASEQVTCFQIRLGVPVLDRDQLQLLDQPKCLWRAPAAAAVAAPGFGRSPCSHFQLVRRAAIPDAVSVPALRACVR